MKNRSILPATAVLAFGLASPAWAQSPQIPTPANPTPANPIATDGSPLQPESNGSALQTGRSVGYERQREASPFAWILGE